MSKKIRQKTFLLTTVASALLTVVTGVSAIENVQPANSALTFANSQAVDILLVNGEKKTIRFPRVHLSAVQQTALLKQLDFAMAHPVKKMMLNHAVSAKVDLGMNGVPVLDQGPWGTCVTFAVSGAIDAFYPLKNSDTVSQLCSLELGKTLSVPDKNGGWEGSWGNLVLNEVSKYGYITTAWQKENGCGGLKEYPVSSSKNNGTAMPVSTYTANSIKKFTVDNWGTVFNENTRPDIFHPEKKDKVVDMIRQDLSAGYRVTFGFVLDPYSGVAGAVGAYNNVQNDTWVLTDQVAKNLRIELQLGIAAGHEIIITGYDDNACVKRNDGKPDDCGLFTVRNSWGAFAGDGGNFYMTYDYFKNLALESYVIGKQSV